MESAENTSSVPKAVLKAAIALAAASDTSLPEEKRSAALNALLRASDVDGFAAKSLSAQWITALRRAFLGLRSEFSSPAGHALSELTPVPLRVSLKLLHRGDASSSAGRKDATVQQARRDIERDSLRLNGGAAISGSIAGYEGVVALIRQSLMQADSMLGAPAVAPAADGPDSSEAPVSATAAAAPLVEARAAALAAELLRACNRTVSGGDAYEAASRLLQPAPLGGGGEAFVMALFGDHHDDDHQDADDAGGIGGYGYSAGAGPGSGEGRRAAAAAHLLSPPPPPPEAAFDGSGLTLVPDSAAAPPLSLTIDCGPFQLAQHEWSGPGAPPPFLGLRCRIEGTSVYHVLAEDAPLEELLPMLQRQPTAASAPAAGATGAAGAASGAASASTAGAGTQPPPRGYLGRLRCTYHRRVAALPACCVLPEQTGADSSAAAVASPASSPAIGFASPITGSAAAAAAATRDESDGEALRRAAAAVVEREAALGRQLSPLELAAVFEAARRDCNFAAAAAATAPANSTAASSSSSTGSAASASSAASSVPLPPLATRLFDAGLEAYVELQFEAPQALLGKAAPR